MLADSFVFQVFLNNMSPQDTWFVSSWHDSYDWRQRMSLQLHTKKVSVCGNGIFMTPRLSPKGTRDQQCTMRFQQFHGNWSLELLTPFSCPHQAFRHFIITNETLSLTGIKGLSSFSPWGGILRRQLVYSLTHPLQIKLPPQRSNIPVWIKLHNQSPQKKKKSQK